MFIFLVYPCELLHKSFSAHIPNLTTNFYKLYIFPYQLLPYVLVHSRSSFPSLCTICLQLYSLTNYNIHFHTYSIPFLSHFAFFFFRFSFTLFQRHSLEFRNILAWAITGFSMLNSLLIFLSRSSPLSSATHSFRPSTTFSCTARCTSLHLHQICTSVSSSTLHSRHLPSLNPLFRSLPMLPHFSLAHVSLISPLISLSSQYFSISIPSFLFLYSLQNFDLSILSQSCCIFWSVVSLLFIGQYFFVPIF